MHASKYTPMDPKSLLHMEQFKDLVFLLGGELLATQAKLRPQVPSWVLYDAAANGDVQK